MKRSSFKQLFAVVFVLVVVIAVVDESAAFSPPPAAEVNLHIIQRHQGLLHRSRPTASSSSTASVFAPQQVSIRCFQWLNRRRRVKATATRLWYGERSRPLRRDVFAYDDWVRHRSIHRDFLATYKSGVVKQLLKQVYLKTGVAIFICVYNALLVNGFDDFAGIHHDPLVQGFYVLELPFIVFALTSPVLSLLLGK